MDSFQFWLYIIIGVIYLLSRLRKKPDEQQPTDFPGSAPEKPVRRFEQPNAKPTASQRPLTFEELLREITEGKVEQQLPPREEPRQEYVDYDDNVGEEEKDLEEVDYDYRKQDKIYEVYEEAKRQAFNRPSLEETMKVSDTVVKYGKFKEFEQAKQRDLAEEYLADFNDPEGLKKAIVMSEILKRKF
jgi:hypothetical protein